MKPRTRIPTKQEAIELVQQIQSDMICMSDCNVENIRKLNEILHYLVLGCEEDKDES